MVLQVHREVRRAHRASTRWLRGEAETDIRDRADTAQGGRRLVREQRDFEPHPVRGLSGLVAKHTDEPVLDRPGVKPLVRLGGGLGIRGALPIREGLHVLDRARRKRKVSVSDPYRENSDCMVITPISW
jgi:hypothetical protein